ncbi:hypothetical protein [Frankia gtarii]|uniref:hypothetical protein n=1 Tax=Frankia gtarii TaxID=2950102 RepID=UPI0021BEB51A|nr:hypothetical protein [Frankia gtarii]
MSLRDTLEESFTADGFDLTAALGLLTTAFHAVAPAGVDVDVAAVAGLAEDIAGADPAGALTAVAALAGKYGGALAGVADPAHLAEIVARTVDALDALGTHLDDLRTGVVSALSTQVGDRPVDRFVAGAEALRGLPVAPLAAAARALAPVAGAALPPALAGLVPDLLGQAGAVRTLTDQIALITAGATVAARVGELTGSLAAVSDPAALAAARTGVLALDGVALAALVGGAEADDTVVTAVAAALAVLDDYADALNRLVLGAGVVVEVLDPTPLANLLAGASAGATAAAGGAATAPVRALAQTLVTRLEPILRARPTTPNALSPTAFADTVAVGLDQVVTAVRGIDVARIGARVTTATDAVLAPVRLVGTALRDALETVRAALEGVRVAVESVGLDAVTGAIHTVIDPVVMAVTRLGELIAPVAAAISAVAADVAAQVATLRAALDSVVRRVSAAFAAAAGAVSGLDIARQLAAARAALDGVAATIEGLPIGTAVDQTVGFVHDAATVISKIPFDLLPDSAVKDLHDALTPLKAINFGKAVGEPLSGAIAEILTGIDGPLLDEVAQAFAEVADFLARLDPRPSLAAVERDGFDPFLVRVQSLDPDAIIAPVRDALRSLGGLKDLLAPADQAFDTLLRAVDALDPAPLLDPIVTRLDDARAEIRRTIGLSAWAGQVDAGTDQLLAAIDLVRLADVLDGAVELVENLLPAAGSERRGSAGGQVLARLLGPAAAALDLASFATVGDWLTGRRGPVDDLTAGLTAARAAVHAARDRITAADPEFVVAAATPAFDQVTAAVGALPAGERRDRLAALVATTPAGRVTVAAGARADVLVRLDAMDGLLDGLAAVGAAPLGALSTALRAAFEPLAPVRDSLAAWVTRAGGNPGVDLGAALREVFALVADRLRPGADAFDAAVRDVLRGVAETAVRAPLRAAATELDALVGALDARPVAAEIAQLFTSLRAGLGAARPSTALADLVTAIDGLVGDTAAWDPFRDARGPVEQIKRDIAAATDELRPTVLLAPVIETYTTVVATVRELDVRALFARVLAAVHVLADEVTTGLAEAGSAFEELRAALP